MQQRNTRFVALLAIASAAVLAISTGLASASGTSTGAEVHVYEADTNDAGNLGTVILTGAITDYGTDHQNAGPNGTNLFALSKGSFAVDITELGTRLHKLPFSQTTCSSGGTVTWPVKIVPGSGTGAYTGISGTLHATASEAYILPRKHGRCEMNASDYRGVLIANASGTVSYK